MSRYRAYEYIDLETVQLDNNQYAVKWRSEEDGKCSLSPFFDTPSEAHKWMYEKATQEGMADSISITYHRPVERSEA